MSPRNTSPSQDDDAWDDGRLGRDAAHVRRAPASFEAQVDEALCMQAISIRLPRPLIQTFKNLAQVHGVGYQPLMRDALERFASAEMKHLLAAAVAEQDHDHAARAKTAPRRKVA